MDHLLRLDHRQDARANAIETEFAFEIIEGKYVLIASLFQALEFQDNLGNESSIESVHTASELCKHCVIGYGTFSLTAVIASSYSIMKTSQSLLSSEFGPNSCCAFHLKKGIPFGYLHIGATQSVQIYCLTTKKRTLKRR